MGSAQSARRIQPGGARPAVPVVPADLSRSPFLPTPPPARLSPPSPRPAVAVPAPPSGGVSAGAPAAGAGCGGGARAGPGVGSAGDRPPVGDRPPPGALPPWRCAATGSGTAGKARRGRWLGGGGVTRGRRTTPPRVLQPPGSSARRIPGPREPDTRRHALPPASPLPPLPVGWRKGGRSRGPGRPSHGATALPPPVASVVPLGGPGARGAGRTVPSAPRASSRRRARGGRRHALSLPFSGWGGAKPSARGRRRCRLPTRPVLKHGPRSLTRARVRGSSESRRGAMKVKGPVPGGPEVGSRGLSSPPRAHHRPVSPAAPGRWSTSVRVRTRKMVNYAWAGRSQRKLWWRSVAVLTCKSVVRPGYRGERLIEPSSSWFPPKFPSG